MNQSDQKHRSPYAWMSAIGLLFWIIRIIFTGPVPDFFGMLGSLLVVIGLIGMMVERLKKPSLYISSTSSTIILPASFAPAKENRKEAKKHS